MAGKRNTATETKLQQAITKLLSVKTLDQVSVSDICREAGINRGTFYAHYIDKYDFFDKQIDSLVAVLSQTILEPVMELKGTTPHELIPQEGVLKALVYVKEHYDLVAALTQRGTNMQLHKHVQDIIGELLEQSAAVQGIKLSFGGLPEDYGREMVLSGITAVMWHWIKKGCVESPEEIVRIVWTNKSYSPEELLTGTVAQETSVRQSERSK